MIKISHSLIWFFCRCQSMRPSTMCRKQVLCLENPVPCSQHFAYKVVIHMAGTNVTCLKHKKYYMAWEDIQDLLWRACLPNTEWRVFRLLQIRFLCPTSTSLLHQQSYNSTLVNACYSLISSIQLDIDDREFTRVVLTAKGVGVLSGLVFCTAAAFLLPRFEQHWEDRVN